VDATGYVSLAERPPDSAEYPDDDPELLVAGSAVFHPAPRLWDWTSDYYSPSGAGEPARAILEVLGGPTRLPLARKR
jgi:hypothetical protein